MIRLTLLALLVLGNAGCFDGCIPDADARRRGLGRASIYALGDMTTPVDMTSAGPNYIRLTSLTGLTEAANGGGGWDYTGHNSGYSSDYGISTVKLPSGQDGWIGAKIKSSSPGAIIGVRTTSTNGLYTGMRYAIYVYTGGNANYQLLENGSGVSPDTSRAVTTNDIIAIRRTGSTITAERSSDGGSTWQVTKTWAGGDTGDWWANMQSSGGDPNAVIYQPQGSSNVQ